MVIELHFPRYNEGILGDDDGLVTKLPYQLRPKRFEYVLTPKGEALLPVLQEMCRWANRFIPGTWTPPASFMTRA
jgi:DNA-binding HxlR family transcriptional regulator